MTPQHHVARELAANAEALRGLARDLVGPAMASDLVQETALRALRSPPPQPTGLGAWLATILRNLAGNHRRDERRRRAREAAVAPRDATQPAADEDAARRELLQAMTRALWQLPEPYQSALVWRYFENRTPTQIAADERLPLATVKSRLQRGLAMLRDQFDRRDGGRWRAVLPFALAVPRTLPTVSTLAVLMTPTTKLCAAAAVLLAAAVCTFFAGPAGPPTPPAEVTLPVAHGAGVGGGFAPDPAARGRELVAEAAAPVVDLGHAHVFRLRCAVLDRDGLPVVGAKVVFAPRDSLLNEWPQPTGPDGVVELEWRGKQAELTIAVGLVVNAHAQMLREVDVRAGAVQRLVLLAERGGQGGACAAIARAKQVDCRSCHVGALLPQVFDRWGSMAAGLHAQTRLVDMLVGTPPSDEEVTAFDDFGAENTVGVQTAVAAPTGRIEGRVVDANGAGVAGTTVIWGRQPDRASADTRTGPDGSFAFDGVGVGVVQVRAGGGSPGIGRATREVFAGTTSVCDIVLQRGDVLAGRVLLPDSASAEGWRVEYVTADETWIDGAAVAADGAFAFANVPPGAGTLLLWSKEAHRLPAAADGSTLVGSTDVCFDLRTTGVPAGVLRVRPGAVAADLAERAAVFVWQVASRRGAMAVRRKDGARELDGLPAGFHRVAIGGIGSGWQDLGEHWIDGTGVVDLGLVPLRAHGTLLVEGRSPGQDLQLYLRRPELDLRGDLGVPGRDTLWLPPGRWLALWGEPALLQHRELDVRAGEVTHLRLTEPR